MVVINALLLFLMQIISSLSEEPTKPDTGHTNESASSNGSSSRDLVTSEGTCGKLGNCDFLVTASLFQIGTCGRAARCSWELNHLKIALKGESGGDDKEIQDALCSIPTYKLLRDLTSEKEKKELESLFVGMQPNTSEYEYYPLPTQYFYKTADNSHNIVPGILDCKKIEAKCTKMLNEEIKSLCNAMPEDKLKTFFEKHMHHKTFDGKNVYRLPQKKDNTNNTMNNGCSLEIYTKKHTPGHSHDDMVKYEYGFSSVYPRLRPPYFELALLYAIDPNGKLGSADEKYKGWTESKAYPELAQLLPEKIIKSVHLSIKHVYDDIRKNLELHSRKIRLEWKPEKFCGQTSTFVCIDEKKIKPYECPELKTAETQNESDKETQTPATGDGDSTPTKRSLTN